MTRSTDNKIKKYKFTITARWPRLLCVEDAAEYLNISPKTIRNGLARNAPSPFPVRPKRFGKRVLFDIQDLDNYVDELPRG
jgi:hypothetical protein